MDKLTKAERSALMSRVRSKGTKPELKVRKLIHGMGFRYRLYSNILPGHPDLVLASLPQADEKRPSEKLSTATTRLWMSSKPIPA